MLILSDFHDYYDSVLKVGIDKTIVFRRKEKEIVFEMKYMDESNSIVPFKESIPFHKPWDTFEDGYTAIPFIIGYAGKLKLGYEVTYRIAKPPYYMQSDVTEYAYSVDDIIHILKKNELEKGLEKFVAPVKKSKYKPSRVYVPFKEFAVANAFDEVSKINSEIFVNFNTPVFLIKFGNFRHLFEREILIINPRLADYKFQGQVDPFTMFQEISMYISGVLGVGQPETVNISDKEMSRKKGFDNMSFKTVTPGKKYNRRNK